VTTDRTSNFLIPNTFLDGFAHPIRHAMTLYSYNMRSSPRLRSLHFSRIPALLKLLGTATDLTTLSLNAIPSTTYVRPEVLALFLFGLTTLEDLIISFESPKPQPGRRNRLLPPKTRTVLPALTSLSYIESSPPESMPPGSITSG
jgi:hypothetical protein